MLALALAVFGFSGCSSDSGQPAPSGSGSPLDSAGPGGLGADQPADPSASASEAAPGATDVAPTDGGVALPTVSPAPSGDAFCAAFNAYLNAGGPYDALESGGTPPFTQADIDAYKALQASAPAAIKPTVDKLLAYGQEMNAGDYSHLADYETLLGSQSGLEAWTISYCNISLTGS